MEKAFFCRKLVFSLCKITKFYKYNLEIWSYFYPYFLYNMVC